MKCFSMFFSIYDDRHHLRRDERDLDQAIMLNIMLNAHY